MTSKNSEKIILDLCGGTGNWSRPYTENRYDVRLIDIKKGFDVCNFHPPEDVYGVLAAPPCPMFSFCRTNAKEKRDLKQAMKIVKACLRIIWECQYDLMKDTTKKPNLTFWALENPDYGMLRWFLGEPTFVFDPYEFGDNYKKRTALWGYFNKPRKNPIYCNQTKFDRLLIKEIPNINTMQLTRTERRAITPSRFADAFFKENM